MRPATNSPLERVARFLTTRTPSTYLTLLGGAMAACFYFAFTDRYPLAIHGNKPLQTIATLNRMAPEGAFLYLAAFIALFGLYAIGYRVLRRRNLAPERASTTWFAVIALGIVMNGALLALYPVDAADVYDYIVRGRMTAFYGLNPLRDVPNQIADDPFVPLAAWKTVPSAYGPLWEIVAAIASTIAGGDLTANVVAYKMVSILGYVLTAVFVGLALREIAPRRALSGVYLFAWNPLMIFMAGGTAHNDTLMTACMVAGLYLLARRWYVAATIAALLGALVKFIPAMLIPIIVVIAFRELALQGRVHQFVRYLALSAGLGILIGVFTYGPFWFGLETLRAERRAQMYTGSAATIIRQTIVPTFDPGKDGSHWIYDTPNTNTLISNTTLILFGAFFAWALWGVFRDRSPVAPARALTLILSFYLLVACLWFQAWYLIWLVGVAVLLDDAPLQRLALIFSYLVTWQPLLYNYVTLRPGGFAPLPWRDLVPVSVFIGGSWLYVAWIWLSGWVRMAMRTPENVALGHALGSAREKLGIAPATLCDELGWRTDDLLGYECGDRSIPLDRYLALTLRLGLPAAHLLPDEP